MAAGVGASLGLVGSASASGVEDQYRTVIDVVDAGADNEGNESITPVLRKHRGDNTLLKFPKGRYYMDSQFRFTDFENFGMVGYDATLEPANYYHFDGPQYRLFRLGTGSRPGHDLRIEGFHVDQTAPETGIRVLSAEVTDGLFVQDVYIDGVHDSGTWGPGLFNITDSNGSGVVRRFRASDGGIPSDESPHAGNTSARGPCGINTNGNHKGSIRYESCVLGGFPGNGLYAVTGGGRVDVDHGWFQNSLGASVRLGAPRGSITDAVMVVNKNSKDTYRQIPLRIDYANWFTIENVSIRMPRPNGYALRLMDGVNGAVIRGSEIDIGPRVNSGIRIDHETGPSYIDDVDIRIDGGGSAIKILGRDAGEIGLQDVRIKGDASGSPMRYAIYCERNGCRFRHMDVVQRGDSRRRGLQLNGEDYVVYDCGFTTTNCPIVVNGDDVWFGDCYSNAVDDSASLRLTSVAGNNIRLGSNYFPDGVSDRR